MMESSNPSRRTTCFVHPAPQAVKLKMTVMPRLVSLLTLLSLPAFAASPSSMEEALRNLEAESNEAAPSPERGPEPVASVSGERKDAPVAGGQRAPETEGGTEARLAGPDANQAAEELPDDGVWKIVDSLEGEVPSEEQMEAMTELQAEFAAELALLQEFGGEAAPVDFYQDPKAVLYVDPLHLDKVDPSEFDIPIVVNDSVRKWVKYFTGPGRKYYAKWLSRSSRYRPMMYRELEAAGLPQDLVYLSMIESGYNAHAYSHAAAAGLWQFIPSTGRLYKMRVDWWIDERRDPEISTKAAIAYLSELNRMFDGDWYLAFASYNGGPGRVRRATVKANSKDFWVLANGPYLHSETDNYVPKIIAAAIIGKHPERYGFTDIQFQDELVYESTKVPYAVELDVLAKCAGISVEELKHLNPHLRRYATPNEGTVLRLPKGSSAAFTASLAKVPANQRISITHHKVSRGETLSVIASKYGVSVSAISRANNLRNVNRIYVGMNLVIPVHGQVPTGAVLASSSSTKSSGTSSASRSIPASYTVQRGDTLSGIAAKYSVSQSRIRELNAMKSSTVYVGQKLKLGGSGAAVSGGSSGSTQTHVVQNGETLSGIAGKYGVRQSDLQAWNNISNASHIRVGQKLVVKGGTASSWQTYTVRNGDSLGRIATQYGVSVKDLQSWNSLRSTTIHPGQKLKVKRG